MKKVLKKTAFAIISFWILVLIVNQFIDRSIRTEIIIQASTEKVWKELLDHSSYREWNPFIKEISGSTKEGDNLKVYIQPKGQDGMNFEPKVLVNKESQEFRWVGKLGFSGIFDGEHYFILEQTENGSTKFIQGENFSGVLSGMFMSMIKESTKQGFIDMNESLKERVEKQISSNEPN